MVGDTPSVTDPSPIISADELMAILDRPDADSTLRICDVRWYLSEPGRGRREYEAGRLPGAIFVDVDTVLAAREGPGRHPLPSPATFAATLGQMGIGPNHTVIAYDDPGATLAAARLWWMLDDLGHRDIRVLDGGFAAWKAAGGATSTAPPDHPPTSLGLREHWTKIIDREALRPRLGHLTVLDARAGERYRGEIEPIDPVAGHIPTALSATTGGNLDDAGNFLPPDRLRARFTGLGCADTDVVTSCGSGITACHNALAMRVAGLPDPLLYPGSYSDWTRAHEPIAIGSEPGLPPPSPPPSPSPPSPYW
jgi:thiosulfate/3-mercaptopyruvate sulfurtransferase